MKRPRHAAPTRRTQKAAAAPAVQADSLDDGITSGRCISCWRIVGWFPPMDKQLPHTSPRYPLCGECLTLGWKRWGAQYGGVPEWVE